MASPTKAKVVVIGAGAAGIAAAAKLFKNQFDVVVLEAEDRIGGRICSHETDHGWVEFGAQWIHGEHHWLFDYAKSSGILGKSVHLDRETGVLFQDHREISSDEHVEIQKCIRFFCDEVSPERLRLCQPDTNVGTKLQQTLNEAGKSGGDEKELEAVYDWMHRYLKLDCGADSLHDVSVRNYIEELCDGNYNHQLNMPYVTLLEHIRKFPEKTPEFPLHLVRLNTSVSGLSLSKTNAGINVQTSRGPVFYADHVIVTVSLGVLKKQLRNWFSPPLPARKQDAIRSLGYGIIGKVILFYEQPFWSKWKFDYVQGATRALSLFWNGEKSTADSWDAEKRYATEGWFRAIRSFLVLETCPNVLVAFVAGRQVQTMENLPDDQIAQDITSLLRTFSGSDTVPLPTKVMKSRWGSNQNFCGTYSYISQNSGELGFGPADLAEPAWLYKSSKLENEPNVPGLLFAGEATHPEYFSMVQGALLSGWREADRIIDLYKSAVNTN